MRRRTETGAVIAGLVAIHEHERTLKQERRLAGRPSFGDRVPLRRFALIVAGLTAYGLVLVVIAAWPWLVALAVLVATGLIWRKRRHRRRA